MSALAITDLSAVPRLGFKGRDTLGTVQSWGLKVENLPNRAFRQDDGSLAMVLAPGEVFILGHESGDNELIGGLSQSWQLGDEVRCYPMPRRDSHGWYKITGDAAPEMFAKLCAVDLRLDKFSDLSIAQTSVARLNTIVLRADQDGPVFHVLSDSSASAYMLSCLVDAAEEFSGRR